jgi:phenylpropionate dioxygenase-like ring-hydroxylating dioxygenase large terminal subunit
MSRTHPQHTTLPLPNGWFAVAWSRDLVAGDVRRVHYFEEDLVLFRTRSGAAKVLDGHCPHLGAHLAEGGRVIGEAIRCPFHGWQFDGHGRCVEIPYCKRIPPRAVTRAWDVLERNGMIFVWRHAEAKPPDWEVPAFRELEDPAWTEPRTFEIEVPVHMQEMHENNNDPVHFHFVHGNLAMPQSEVRFGEGGRTMHMVTPGKRETPYGTFDTRLETDSWGLGVAAVRICGIADAGLLMFSSTSPIDRSHSHSRWIFTVTRNLADIAGEDFVAGLTQGVLQDMRIWSNKIHRAQPVFCEGDAPIAEFRRWAKQFYSVDAAAAAAVEPA